MRTNSSIESSRHIGLRVPFGRRLSDGRICEPLEVEIGKKCGCVCPGCQEPLIAKHCLNGGMTPHFAHRPDSDCKTGFITALHEAAVQLILDRMECYVPKYVATYTARDALGGNHVVEGNIVQEQLLSFTQVEREPVVANIRPDILATSSIGQINIEIAVTHFVDADKLQKLKLLKLATLEVDLGDLDRIDFSSLSECLFNSSECVRWLYHPEADQHLLQAKASLAPILAEAKATALANEEARCRESEAEAKEQRQAKTKQFVHELEQRKQHVGEIRRANKFRALPEKEKLNRVLTRLALEEPPSFLTAQVRGGNSFGVHNVIVWQLTLVGGLIHNAVANGHPQLNVDFASQWLANRFSSSLPFQNADKVAIWDYLVRLEQLGALRQERRGYFLIRVSSLETLSHLVAYRERCAAQSEQVQIQWLDWTTEEDWPLPNVSRVLAAAHAGIEYLSNMAHPEGRLTDLLPEVRNVGIDRFIAYYQDIATTELILEYLLAAGFIRVRAQ